MPLKLYINDKFTNELPADKQTENTRRQVENACFSYVIPQKTKQPKMLHISTEMLEELGISQEASQENDFLNVFTGNALLQDSKPYAMCYGGHQFGNWAGQLGDGRAINLAEITHNNKNWALQLKGAGATPYSRTADGLAVLRSSIREYLCSEAMFHLGIPTTRALSLALTGDKVLRDVLYDGHPAYEKGAVVSRVSPSFIRFGNFEIFASRKDIESLKILTDYTIKHHYPRIGNPSKESYIQFIKEVGDQSIEMVMHWQRVGFVHGVMNTDNMSILGLTIDYGPYGWLEGYDHGWTPNTTDNSHRRYRYGTQLKIVLWNMYKLANALYPLIEEVAPLEALLEALEKKIEDSHLKMMKSKLGLEKEDIQDKALILELENVLQLSETDMTIFFRLLSNYNGQGIETAITFIKEAFYTPEELEGNIKDQWSDWFLKYKNRLGKETKSYSDRKMAMNLVNPKYVLRNYMAQLAIDAADKKDYSLIDNLFNILRKPYDEQPENEKWFAKRPEWARNKVGCSMLSCSS